MGASRPGRFGRDRSPIIGAAGRDLQRLGIAVRTGRTSLCGPRDARAHVRNRRANPSSPSPRSREITLFRAIGVQSAGALACAAVSFALVAFLGRMLGPASFGAYASALAIAAVALIAIEGGWSTYLYRERAGNPAPEAERALTGHALAHVATATGVATAIAATVRADTPAIALAIFCIGLVAAGNLVSARMRGIGAFGREAAWQLALRIASAALVVAALATLGPHVPLVFAAWAAALAVLLAAVGRHWLALPRWRGLSACYPAVLPFVAADGLMIFMLRSDVAVLDAYGMGSVALSSYAACTRFNEVALLAAAPVANVLLRNLRMRRDDRRRYARLWQTAVALALGAGLVAVGVAARYGERIVTTIFGTAYAGAGGLLPWVVAALPFALANLLLVPTLVAAGRERWLAAALTLAGGLVVAALGIGLARDGARGAAIGAIGAQLALFALLVAGTRAPRRDAA